MSRLGRMPFRAKLLTFIFLIMLLLTSSISGTLLRDLKNDQLEQVADMTEFSLRVLATDMKREYPDLDFRISSEGEVFDVVWQTVAQDLPENLVDQVGRQTQGLATVFRWDPDTGEYVRVMTNIIGQDGKRAVGTVLGRDGPVHAAIRAGIAFRGEATILGLPYITTYQPIKDATGQINGIFFVGVEKSSINSKFRHEVLQTGGIALVGFVVASLCAYLVIGVLLRPLASLSGAIRQIASGDYDVEPSHQNVNDQIGDIARSIADLRDQLVEARALRGRQAELAREADHQRSEQARVVSELTAGLERLTSGDLTKGIDSPANDPFPADYAGLRESYNSVVDRFNGIVMQIREIAEGVRGGSDEIAQVSKDISSRAETQAATLEESAAALNQLTESVRSTAERAAQAKRASHENRGNAEAGATIVRDAIGAMEGIEKSSEQITRIIGVIDDIAFQTNLLALNAGVEAARAGDAGRGFAVVATEVRLLAQRASESAREIKALISESAAQVNNGSALVNRTGASLEEILARAAEAASLASDIAVAASEQATGLDEINSGVNQLDQVTQQNAAVAEQTTAAATSLLQKSEDLMRALDGFRTTGQSRSIEKSAERTEVADWAAAARSAITRQKPTKARSAGSKGSWEDF